MKVFWQEEKLPLKKTFFGPKEPRFLEIGFGKGDFMIHLFALDSSSPLVGIEISKEMINITLRKLSYHPNIFLFHGDARFLLKYVFPYFLFEKIFMLFPFPWPKERHKERRIFEGDFINILWYSLKDNGKFYTVTDEEVFSQDTKEKFMNSGVFEQDEFEDFFRKKATETKYARKWRKAGKNFYFLCFKKIKEKKPKIEKKIKIINKVDHFILKNEKFKDNYEKKEEGRIFILKEIYFSESGKIFKFFVKEEILEQTLFFTLDKKRNFILKPLFKERIIFTEWILENLKKIFDF